jgi:hypothetical protein
MQVTSEEDQEFQVGSVANYSRIPLLPAMFLYSYLNNSSVSFKQNANHYKIILVSFI